MRQDESGLGQTGGHDGVRDGDRGLQLDQGDVVTGDKQEESRVWQLIFHTNGVRLESLVPDEQGAPLLVHNDAGGAHEHSVLFSLFQVVFSQGHSVLFTFAAQSQKRCYVQRLLT